MSQTPLPPPPSTSFYSDNTSGMAPAVLEALAAANAGPAHAYGDDELTERVQARFRELFGDQATALLCWGGTGANLVGLATLVRPYEGIICPATAHVNVDECGGPERFLGSKLIDVPTTDGKLHPADVEAQLGALGDVHHVQPGAISLAQSTEYGTVYSVEELAAVCGAARRAGLRVHVDGARLANAVAALGTDVRRITTDLGVDVLTFGGTKNGIACGEAVVFLDPELATAGRFHQKQAAQLPSKTRFVAAQLDSLLAEDRWLDHARHANTMAQRLATTVEGVPGVEITQAVDANAVFARLPRASVERLRTWSEFYVWQPGRGDDPCDEVRWMTSFQTTEADVDRFAAGVAAVLTG